MMENLISEEENIGKDIQNIFILKKELNYTAIKDTRNAFRPKKKLNQSVWKLPVFSVIDTFYAVSIKNRILKDIKNLLELEKEEENYYKPVTVNNFWGNKCNEYEVMVIEIKQYQFKNIIIKLVHI